MSTMVTNTLCANETPEPVALEDAVSEDAVSEEAVSEDGASEAPLRGPAPSRGPAVALLVFSIWQSFWISGIVNGWPALLNMLKQEGMYADLCHDGKTGCAEQAVAFNLIFTTGSVANVAGGIIAGAIVDRFGAKRPMVVGGLLTAACSTTMAFADLNNRFIWPIAYAVMGLSGQLVYIPSISVSNVLGSARGCIICCFVGVFSLSSLTFEIFYFLYEHLGWTREQVLMGHVCIVVVNTLISFWFWPVSTLKLGDSLKLVGARLHVIGCEAQDALATASPARLGLHQLLAYMRSAKYIGVCVWVAVQIWASRCLMGWIEAELMWVDDGMLARGGAGLDVPRQMSIFNASQSILSLFMIPVFGCIVARFGHRTMPFVVGSVMSVIWLAFLMVRTEWSLYVMYVVSGFHRQFAFSSLFTFVMAEFPSNAFGKLSGVIMLVAGLCCATQSPLLELTLHQFDGDFTVLLTVQLVMEALILVVALGACVHEQLNSAAEKASS